jgi:hypothetical protein
MMSHQLDERIRNHAAALDQAAPPFRLDDIRASSRAVGGRRLLRPLVAAAAVVLVVVGGLVAISVGRDPEPEPAAVSAPSSTTPTDTTPTEPSVSEGLDESRTRWAAAAVTSYRLDVTEDRNYWSQGCTWTTLVSDGVVTESTVVAPSTARECPSAEWTVEQLHDLIASWLDSIEAFSGPEFGEHTLQVEYSEIGVPVTMEYDLANGDDEEASMRVTFESLRPDATTAPPRTNPGGVDGPAVFGTEPLDAGAEVEEAALGGTLQLVDECLVAAPPGGSTNQRTLIIWEFGTTWEQSTTSVIQQGGERIAIGEELDLGGGFHPLGSMNRYVSDLTAQDRIRSCSQALGTTELFVDQ